MRSRVLLLGLAALTLVVPSAFGADRPRNVVLLIADDLGMQVGCYDDARARTPHIDGLARSGTRFTHAFATVSSCSPSRASLYSGLYTHTSGQYGLAHGVHNFHSFDNVTSLPKLLGASGYRTGILGKVHVLPREVYNFAVTMTKGTGGNRSVAEMGRLARQFFADSGDKPFALVVGFSDPHRSARGFGNETLYPGVKEAPFDPNDVTVPFFLTDRPDVRRDLADYYQAVGRLDQGVGHVLEALKQTGHADDTLIVFLSDNGIPFPAAKTTLYDPGIHLPFIVSSPGQKARGRTCRAMVSFVDVLPTFLDWTKATAPKGLSGRSLLSILDEEDPKGWDVVYGSHQCHEVTMYYPMRMVRTRQYKYIRNLAHRLEFPIAQDLYDSPTWQGILRRGDRMLGDRPLESFLHRPAEELYDLEKDPHEITNLADSPAHAATLADLRKRMKEWQVQTRDPWLVKYTHE
jgi:N-sulfoglucosamine sulfohydrolase